MNVNKVILLGRLGAAPEMRYTPAGTAVASLRMATSKKVKGKDGNYEEKTQWHNITAWATLAEACNKVLSKGSPVYVEGELEYQTFVKKDGTTGNRTNINANQVVFLGGKPAAEEQPDSAQPMQESDLPF